MRSRILHACLLTLTLLLVLLESPDAQGRGRRGQRPESGRPGQLPPRERIEGLQVHPPTPFPSSGTAGGPFLPPTKAYVLANGGLRPIDWKAVATAPWLNVTPASGTLAPGQRVGVRVELVDQQVERLEPGHHPAMVHFSNESSGEGSTGREVQLAVKPPPGLSVVPLAPFDVLWSPDADARAQVYQLDNRSSQPLHWVVESDRDWLAVAPRAGTIPPGSQALVQAEVLAERIPTEAGEHVAKVHFRNAEIGVLDAEREVRLKVGGELGLLVSPAADAVLAGVGAEAVYELENRARVPLRWRIDQQGQGFVVAEKSGELQPGAKARVVLQSDADVPSGALVFVDLTSGLGTTLRRVRAEPSVEVAPRTALRTSSVSRFGITWTFAHDVQVGRFANGDFWVVGPVALTGITPGALRADQRVLNGSMLNPSPGDGAQGYDSTMFGKYRSPGSYRDSLNVGLDVSAARPLLLLPDSSLVSSVSVPTGGARPQLDTAAILTVLSAPAREGSFRPPYCGSDKTPRFHVDQLKRELLASLERVPSTPSLQVVEGWFERPWLDHIPDWVGRYHHPAQNMPDYGRELCDQVSTAALMLHLDLPLEQKETLLVRFVQLGIDFQGIVQDGGQNNWPPGGGHHSGRKWPILFAGLVLGDTRMSAIGERKNVQFNEDGQTFYVEETSPGVFNEGFGGYGPAHVGLAEWGNQHGKNRSQDDVRWSDTDGTNSHLDYRTCCTANVWWGEVLAARVMGARELWNHDALFDYQDRYREMSRGSGQPGWTVSWSPFQLEMWDRHRPSF